MVLSLPSVLGDGKVSGAAGLAFVAVQERDAIDGEVVGASNVFAFDEYVTSALAVLNQEPRPVALLLQCFHGLAEVSPLNPSIRIASQCECISRVITELYGDLASRNVTGEQSKWRHQRKCEYRSKERAALNGVHARILPRSDYPNQQHRKRFLSRYHCDMAIV